MFLLPFDFEKILKYLVSYLSYNLEWFSLIFMFLDAENVAECQQLLNTISISAGGHSFLSPMFVNFIVKT